MVAARWALREEGALMHRRFSALTARPLAAAVGGALVVAATSGTLVLAQSLAPAAAAARSAPAAAAARSAPAAAAARLAPAAAAARSAPGSRSGAGSHVAPATHAGPRYYLALGDSLSQGVQPNPAGTSLETNQGYADQLAALERHRAPSLKLVKLGCPGDTTGSMLTGHGNDQIARFFHCVRTGGSQLKAAERFLRAHHRRGQVALVTIDIGANDVDVCSKVPVAQIGSCVTSGVASISHDLPLILAGLRKAAAAGTVLAGMTLYDPVLAGYFSTDVTTRGLASASVALLKQINTGLTGIDAAAGFRTADVAGAFSTYDSTDMVPFGGGSVPTDVARVCTWTWACTPPPQGPNIHANQAGYAVIARALAKVIGRL
jgi:lysophospholipase L1-like esterase